MTPTVTDEAVKPVTLVERAKAILAGTLEPEPLRLPPDVQAWWDEEVKGFDPPATPAAISHHHNRLLLDVLYAGLDLVFTETARGTLAILAVGGDEIRTLYRGLNRDEAKRAIGHKPGPRPW
ncbi:MAG: hypothetical protein ACRC33_14970 [Gemmataceae bacterium]